MVRETNTIFTPATQAIQEMDRTLEPVREQMRINESVIKNIRENLSVNKTFIDNITPNFEVSSLDLPRLESIFSAINTSVIQEISHSFKMNNESIFNEMMTRQLYVNVVTAEVDDDLSEDDIVLWEWFKDKVFEHSETFIYYAFGVGLVTYTTIQIISDPTGLEFLATVFGEAHNKETDRRNKDRDTR